MRQLIRLLSISLCLGITPLQADPAPQPVIALIIDDLGNSLHLGQRALGLPGDVTYSILPHTPYGKRLANEAHKAGKEVMLHLPMSNVHQRNSGPGELTATMPRRLFETRLQHALADVPHVQGINNHMGSELTQLEEPMNWLMRSLQCYRLYFVDSRTSPQSVAQETAAKLAIDNVGRDVFLDHEPDEESISAMYNKLLALARRNGQAVAIAHPHPVTLAYLEQVLPELEKQGIRLVKPSQFFSPEPPVRLAEYSQSSRATN
jgi:polysaccharide deacetylase 2 family uncharacterized protein YibQ